MLFSLGKKCPGFRVYHKTPAVLRTCANTGCLSPCIQKGALLCVSAKGLKRKSGREKPFTFLPGSRDGVRARTPIQESHGGFCLHEAICLFLITFLVMFMLVGVVGEGNPFCFTPGVSEIEELRFWSLRLDKVRQADYFCLKLL